MKIYFILILLLIAYQNALADSFEFPGIRGKISNYSGRDIRIILSWHCSKPNGYAYTSCGAGKQEARLNGSQFTLLPMNNHEWARGSSHQLSLSVIIGNEPEKYIWEGYSDRLAELTNVAKNISVYYLASKKIQFKTIHGESAEQWFLNNGSKRYRYQVKIFINQEQFPAVDFWTIINPGENEAENLEIKANFIVSKSDPGPTPQITSQVTLVRENSKICAGICDEIIKNSQTTTYRGQYPVNLDLTLP